MVPKYVKRLDNLLILLNSVQFRPDFCSYRLEFHPKRRDYNPYRLVSVHPTLINSAARGNLRKLLKFSKNSIDSIKSLDYNNN